MDDAFPHRYAAPAFRLSDAVDEHGREYVWESTEKASFASVRIPSRVRKNDASFSEMVVFPGADDWVRVRFSVGGGERRLQVYRVFNERTATAAVEFYGHVTLNERGMYSFS